MNWVSEWLGRRSSTPHSIQFAGNIDSSNGEVGDGIQYSNCSTKKNRVPLLGQHSLDHSFDNYFDRQEQKRQPKRCWELPKDYIFPDMIGKSTILTDDDIIFLDEEKPDRLVGCTWELAFSTELHGYLLSTMYRNIKSWSGPTLLVIKDKRGHKFGAYVTDSFKPDDKIHGGGECFVFRLKHRDVQKLFDKCNNKNKDLPGIQRFSDKSDDSEAICQQKISSSISHQLLLKEEHFSQDEDNGKDLYSPFEISPIARSTETTEEFNKQNKSKVLGNMSGKRYWIEVDKSLTSEQRMFLKRHDLSEHYVWVWAQENSCFIHGDDQFLHIGMDDGKVTLSLDNMLSKGRSQTSGVFNNEPLAPSLSNMDGDFDVVTVEVWLFKQL